MGTIVVQAHPLIDSYNGALLERVQMGLTAAGEDHMIFRLGEGEQAESAELAAASRLVLVYPSWFSGQPAILLGWLQRMLAADAFGGIDHIQAVTSLGSGRKLNKIQGESGRRYLAKRVVGACAPGATFGWHALYEIDRRTPHELSAFLDSTETLFPLLPARKRTL